MNHNPHYSHPFTLHLNPPTTTPLNQHSQPHHRRSQHPRTRTRKRRHSTTSRLRRRRRRSSRIRALSARLGRLTTNRNSHDAIGLAVCGIDSLGGECDVCALCGVRLPFRCFAVWTVGARGTYVIQCRSHIIKRHNLQRRIIALLR